MDISVIVPVRNEERSIKDLLDGLLSQTLAPSEIVVTDGGSQDNTVSLIQQYIDRGAPITLIRSGPALPGRGRNLAAAAAKSEWLAFIDAGIRPSAEWLQRLREPIIDDESIDVVYGDYEPNTDTFFKECAAISYVPPPFETSRGLIRGRSIASAMVRKSSWQAVGGFPEHLRSAEDLLFMQKLDERGCVVSYAPEATVYWNVQPTVWSTFRRFVTYSENNVRAGLWRQWQARILFRYLMLVLLAAPVFVIGAWWLIAPLSLWLLMLAARAIASLRRNRACYPASVTRNILRFMVILPILATLDAAAIVGTIKWFINDRLLSNGKAVGVVHGGS